MSLDYKIFIDYINKLSIDEQKEYIDNLFDQIYEIHEEKSSETNWIDIYKVEIDYSLYKHGLLKDTRLNDYILDDYIKDNLHFIKNRGFSRLIKNSSIFDIKNDNRVLKSDKFGDKILDYVEVNTLAYFNKDLANYLLDRILEYENNLKFFKILSIYTAKYCIDLIVQNEDEEDENDDTIENIINFIFETYEDFTIYKPNWINK